MAFRKNTKRIDPRYFLHETTHRDEIDERSEHDAEARGMAASYEEGLAAGKAGDPPRLKGGEYMRGYNKGKEGTVDEGFEGGWESEGESFSTSGPDPKDALSTDDLFKLFRAGFSGADLRGVNNANLTPEMKSVLGREAPGASTERDYYADESPYDTGY
jgi:hypothetical protein